MINWAVEVHEFQIKFTPMIAIKEHVVVDLIVESPCKEEVAHPKVAPPTDVGVPQMQTSTWKLYTHVCSFVDGLRAELMLTPTNGCEP